MHKKIIYEIDSVNDIEIEYNKEACEAYLREHGSTHSPNWITIHTARDNINDIIQALEDIKELAK